MGGGIHNDIAIDDLSLTPGCQVGGMSTNELPSEKTGLQGF